MKMTLYDLTGEYMELLAMMEDPDVDPEVLQDTMEAIGGEIEDKAEAYAVIIGELTTKAAQIEMEIRRLEGWVDSLKGNADRMKNRLMTSMTDLGMKKIETEHYRISVSGNGGKQPLRLTGDVPEEYMCMKPEIDTKKIRAALEDGLALDFAHLGERGTHLTIK
jgi:hypothetical protein